MTGKIWEYDPLGKSLDWFISTLNEYAEDLEKKQRESVLEWGRS